MPKYHIYASGVSQQAEYHGIHECKNEAQAETLAWEYACEDYESYAGLHGIMDLAEVAEEYGFNENSNAAWEAFCDERESWLNYHVELVKE